MTLVWAGLSLGAIYALVAVGYNLVFASSGAFNFAQAQLIMVGAFVGYWGLTVLHLPVWLVFVLAAVVVAVIGAIEERLAFRPVQGSHTWLVTTLGISLILNGATQVIWGGRPLTVSLFGSTSVATVDFLGGSVTIAGLTLIVLALVVVGLIVWLSRRLMVGLALLATSEDREAAMLRGVSVVWLSAGAFVIAAGLAGAVGPVVGAKTYAVATLGTALALKGFVALCIGGFGSTGGIVIGAFTVGLVEQFATYLWGAEYATLSVFVLLVLVLMLRPRGLFGRVQERMV